MARKRERLSRLRRRAALLVLAATLVLAAGIPSTAVADHGPPGLLSYGPDGAAAGAEGKVSGDGRHVLLETKARLTAADTDSAKDVYERTEDVTTLVSIGPVGGNGAFDAREPTISEDGSHVFFYTAERLASEDTDSAADVYERFAGTTRLVSTGPDGENAEARLAGITKDGERAFFTTGSDLVPEDVDGTCYVEDYDAEDGSYDSYPCIDIYERSGGTTRLVSLATAGRSDTADASFLGTSDDGTHVFFSLGFQFDYGEVSGIFDRTGGQTILASTSERSSTFPVEVPFVYTGLKAFSNDGSRVIFITRARLVDEDTDDRSDLYMRVNGVTTLISPITTGDGSSAFAYVDDTVGSGAATADLHHVYFVTAQALVAEDTGSVDIYEWSEGTIRLMTPRNNDFPEVKGVSEDGSHVFFTTKAALSADDQDGLCVDLYESVDGVTRLVSTGPTAQRESPYGACPTYWVAYSGSSKNGSRVFFATAEALTADDPDRCCKFDLYERFSGETTLISKGPRRDLFRGDVGVAEVRDDGRRVFFNSVDPLSALDTNTETDYYVATANRPPDCSGVHPDLSELWPANKSLRPVGFGGAADPDGDAVTLEITGVSQDEPAGSPDTSAGADSTHLYLRAERDAKGDGRVYRVAFRVTDALDATCTGTATVSVPRHKHAATVDSAPPSYDFFGG